MLQRVLLGLGNIQLSARLERALAAGDILCDRIEIERLKWREMMMEPFDLIVLDRSVLPKDLSVALRRLGRNLEMPDLVVIIEQDDPNERADLIAAGCAAVLFYKVDPKMQARVLRTILTNRLNRIHSRPYVEEEWRPQLTDFCTKSPAMKKFMKDVHRVIDQDVPLLVLGETGVGKEWLCRAIHNAGSREGKSFVAVNCGALSENLIESELFGHEKGAFTGAQTSHRGCFEQAHKGAIFLDEIGEMPLSMQVKLLRVLQDKQIQRVGSEKMLSVDVRLMAATNRNLEEEVEAGRFRKDLFYRLFVITLQMPSLRQRREDIPTLALAYIQQNQAKFNSRIEELEADALEALCCYDWPGNVRELSNIIERAVLLCDGNCITLNELPHSIRAAAGKSMNMPDDRLKNTISQSRNDNENIAGFQQEFYRMPYSEARKASIDSFDQRYFMELLKHTQGKVNEAAKIAGMNRRTLFDHLQKLGIDKNDYKSP